MFFLPTLHSDSIISIHVIFFFNLPNVTFSEVSGEDIVGDKGQGKPKEQCEKERVLQEKPEQCEKLEENFEGKDKEKVSQEKPEQCENFEENLEEEDRERVWQLEKEAADAVARAAAAVSGEIENE